MTCIVMGKCYIKTGVNVKNGIVQHASVSGRSANNKYPVDDRTALCVI